VLRRDLPRDLQIRVPSDAVGRGQEGKACRYLTNGLGAPQEIRKKRGEGRGGGGGRGEGELTPIAISFRKGSRKSSLYNICTILIKV